MSRIGALRMGEKLRTASISQNWSAKVVGKYSEAAAQSTVDAGRTVSETLLHLRTVAVSHVAAPRTPAGDPAGTRA